MSAYNPLSRLLLFFACLGLLTACGYGFPGSSTVLPDDVRAIYIAAAVNETSEPGLAGRFTEDLRMRFDRYGSIHLVDTRDAADAILNSTVKSVSTHVSTVTGSTDIEFGMELQVLVSAELIRKDGETLWKNEDVKVVKPFASVGDAVVTSSSGFAQSGISGSTLDQLGSTGSREVSRGAQRIALDDALEETARKIYLLSVAESF